MFNENFSLYGFLITHLLRFAAAKAQNNIDDESGQEVQYSHGDLVKELVRSIGDVWIPHDVFRRRLDGVLARHVPDLTPSVVANERLLEKY